MAETFVTELKLNVGDVINVRDGGDGEYPNDWDGIVVDVDADGEIDIAWLTKRSPTTAAETWDTDIAHIDDTSGVEINILRRASYAEAVA